MCICTAYKTDDALSLSCTKTVYRKCSANFKIKIEPFKAKHDVNGYDDDDDDDSGGDVGGGGSGGGVDDNDNDDNDNNDETNCYARFEPNRISQIITQFYATTQLSYSTQTEIEHIISTNIVYYIPIGCLHSFI